MKVKYGDSESSASYKMADLIAFHAFPHSFLSPPRMVRRSSSNRSASPEKTVTKTRSINDLFTASTDRPVLCSSSSNHRELPSDGDFSTIRDPRLSGSGNGDLSLTSSTSHHQHPDLSNEVTALSAKLIQSVNTQTTLDDTLVATRQALDKALFRIQALELENDKYRRDITSEVLVRKADVDQEIFRLKEALAQEKAQRSLVEQGKKTIEQELEDLTTALFEEANKMVAAAKIERDAVEKKNDQLRSQVKDTELLLASHQDQLSELKSLMQNMRLDKNVPDARLSPSPSLTDGPQHTSVVTKSIGETEFPQGATSGTDEMCPGPSTSFPHLIKTVCRTDLPAYSDFRDLLIQAKSSKPSSRVTSGSYAGSVMGFAGLTSSSGGIGSASSSPARSHSHNESLSSQPSAGSHISLREARFYKRVVMEDIEPTLRLDASPGISWLARRTVMSSICDGSLIVEPMPCVSHKWAYPCSLCGERRDAINNERTHRFRTSDSESAQRYPLCVSCVKKVRSCCEFTGYLRLILEGHVRVEDLQEEEDAWEETVRLRERIFWSRVGAGVIPVFPQASIIKRSDLLTTDGSLRSTDSFTPGLHRVDQRQLKHEEALSKPQSGDNKPTVVPEPFASINLQSSARKDDSENGVSHRESQKPTSSDSSDDSLEDSTNSPFSCIDEQDQIYIEKRPVAEKVGPNDQGTSADGNREIQPNYQGTSADSKDRENREIQPNSDG